MIGDFDTILNLVGPLDDAPGTNTPRDRFRAYLASGMGDVGLVRDAVQTCVSHSGPQYARALQDLVNFLGSLMGFEVEYGRYSGVHGKVGHDGMWRSGKDVVVVEVKTTDTYTINTATLPNYINSLKSEGRIKPDDRVIGLYVYAKSDPQVKQLEHAIIAEKRTQELRVGSVEAVLSLAELIREEIVTQDEATAILWPSGVWIDSEVVLLRRIAAASDSTFTTPVSSVPAGASPAVIVSVPGVPTSPPTPTAVDQRHHFLIPCADNPDETARDTIENLVGKHSMWVFGQKTPNRTKVKPGDRVAFYQGSVGVVATAEVATAPEDKPMPDIVKDPMKYRWTFQLKKTHLFLDEPVVIDAAMRANLDEFAGREPGKMWAWFVFATRMITEHDFQLLTGEST
jgi:hypothetical protein